MRKFIIPLLIGALFLSAFTRPEAPKKDRIVHEGVTMLWAAEVSESDQAILSQSTIAVQAVEPGATLRAITLTNGEVIVDGAIYNAEDFNDALGFKTFMDCNVCIFDPSNHMWICFFGAATCFAKYGCCH